MEGETLAEGLHQWAAAADQWLSALIAFGVGEGASFLLVAAVLGIVLGLVLGRKTKRVPASSEVLLLEKPKSEQASSPLSQETGVSDDTLDVLRVRLREWGTPPEEFDDNLHAYALQYRDMAAVLSASLNDPDIGEIAAAAKAKLDTGDIKAAQQIMAGAGNDAAGEGARHRQESDVVQRRAGAAYLLAGDLYLAQDSVQDAMRHYRNAIEVLPATAEDLLAEALNKHGSVAFRSGNLPAAIASFEHALKIVEKTLGAEHEDIATNLNNLGLIHFSQDHFDKAEPLYKRALLIDEKAFGAESAAVATDLNNLALLYKKKGDLAAAEPMFKRSLFIKERLFPAGHPSLATGLKNYAALLRAMGRDAEARVVEGRANAA